MRAHNAALSGVVRRRRVRPARPRREEALARCHREAPPRPAFAVRACAPDHGGPGPVLVRLLRNPNYVAPRPETRMAYPPPGVVGEETPLPAAGGAAGRTLPAGRRVPHHR